METAYIADNQQTLLSRLLETERRARASVPAPCARVRRAEGSWSVLEVAEHIVLSDRGMLDRYRDAGENTHPVNRDAERFIATLGRDPLMEMDGYQLLLLIAAHWERHARQIEAVTGRARYRAANRQRTAG
jgi:hypothetical protein